MSKTPPERPAQRRFKDHAVIVPPDRLKKTIVHTHGPGVIAMDAVDRAEAALANLQGEFAGWMQAECDRLDAARQSLQDGGFTTEAVDTAFRASQDIKGHSSTLGFPLAGRFAASLCRLLMHAPDRTRVPLALINAHADAIRAVVRENVRDAYDGTGLELSERLAKMVETFLAHELKDAYPEIAADAAPVLKISDVSR